MKNKRVLWILFTIVLMLFIQIGAGLFLVNKYNVRLVTFRGRQELKTNVTPESYADLYDDVRIIFEDENVRRAYSYKDLGVKIQWTDEQKDLFNDFAVNIDDMQLSFNYSQKLKDIVEGLNNTKKDWISATFEETESTFLLTEEQEGNKIDILSVENYILSKLTNRSFGVNLDKFTYKEPEGFIRAEKYKDEALRWSAFHIVYSNGFTIKADDVKQFFTLTDEHKIVFKEEMKEELTEQAWEWVNKDLESYNTLGGTFDFITYKGEAVKVEGINYGDKVDKEKEVEYLVNSIENFESNALRVPEMSIDYPDDIQSKVIEISIRDQHLWYWQNDGVYMETDIVTGWKDKWDTPKGVYQIVNKIKGTYLIGSDYKVWVDRWMKIWKGYGIHDAMWRNKFGGAIYEKDGSHGCLNIPHDFMLKLYDMVEVGDCVVIY